MADKVIAVSAGKEITEAEFAQFVARIPQQQQEYIKTPEGRQQALTQYANYFLFEAYGKDKGYDKEEAFRKALEGTVRELLAQYTLTREVENLAATEEECRAYFEENESKFQKGAQAKAKHILIDSEDKANDIRNEIESGAKSFEDAAKEYSTCPSASRGGDLGNFGRGQMVPEFDEAVFSAEVGQLLGPVKTQFGYHLIVVDELSLGEQASYEEVAPQLRQQLTNEKQNQVYMQLRAELISKYGLEFK